MKHDLILHIIRNPYGWADDEVRNARLVAAALIEQQGNQLEQQAKQIEALKADAMRYRFLRDNGHLNQWWSVSGPSDRRENIDADIDAAMTGQ